MSAAPVLLSPLGWGVLGLVVAELLEGLFVAKLAELLPRADQIHLDPVVLVFTVVISLLTSLSSRTTSLICGGSQWCAGKGRVKIDLTSHVTSQVQIVGEGIGVGHG